MEQAVRPTAGRYGVLLHRGVGGSGSGGGAEKTLAYQYVKHRAAGANC